VTTSPSKVLVQRALQVPVSYVLFAILFATLWAAKPHMLNLNILGIFLRQIVPLGILVLGQALVMRVRSIDLSGGGVILLINYYISSGLFPGASVAFFAAIALATGVAIGLFNGIMVAKRRVSAVIVTLGVSIVIVGLVQALSSGRPPGDVPSIFADLYNTRYGFLPSPVIFWVALTIAMSLFLSQSVFGRYVTSVGANAEAARFSGVPVERTVIVAHTVAGVIAAIAALVQTASIAVGSVRVGLDLPILSVAATILGGGAFGGGRGGVWAAFFGALCFAILFVLMTSFGVGESGKLIAQGLIILVAAIFYGLRSANA
jgi:ribose transport system permease protein